jgi:uncharacterized membrane protein YgdD (TMEM256/DUF423 family)
LAGAAGVALAAVAAHRIESPALVSASTMLILHAGAAIALLAAGALVGRMFVTALMLFAVSLFAGDIALNTFTEHHLFPMAAPTGGSLLIASWIAVAGLGICALSRA